jgi:hypothetical protein
MSPFSPESQPVDLGQRLGRAAFEATPFGLPFAVLRGAGDTFRLAGGIFDRIYGRPEQPAGELTQSQKDAQRKRGTKATLGGKPVVWDDVVKQWIPDFQAQPSQVPPITGAPPAPPVDVEAPPAPALPPPLETRPNTTSTPSTLEGQKPDIDPNKILDYNEKLIRDYFLPLREAERQAELQRSIVTAALRDRGLKELSRRQIETENIRAWRELQVARENARAAQAISLANTAYLAQIPNTGVMAAMNDAMRGAMQQISIQVPTTPTGRNLFG